MEVRDLSICFTTDRIQECREFYIKYFDVDVTFDHSWYISIRFKSNRKRIYLSFMAPQFGEPLYNNGGITINLWVKDVDAEHEKLQKAGLKITRPLQDNPWGDRSFEVNDPLGNILYIYKYIKPTEEYAASNK
jgi:uncharacterized glyoxalase superfamily protein PhnB